MKIWMEVKIGILNKDELKIEMNMRISIRIRQIYN